MVKQIQPVLVTNEKGIYCPKGDFYIDPWKPVKNAIVTHAHADHLRFGNKNYIVTNKSLSVTRHRLSKDETKGKIIAYEYDENFDFNGVTVSFHPAGHILGSAQVRVEIGNQVAVASGDYKRSQDPTCQPFELQKCDQFISEATFGLPIYRWRDGSHIGQQMIDWWRRNADENRP
ncbi:MAG: hypothetical protein IH840_02045 [Candidatus Heimdallarchaeota archaeon]|nr:hypothetical protein [Candidatus Heimdallarchaeota archaeon]